MTAQLRNGMTYMNNCGRRPRVIQVYVGDVDRVLLYTQGKYRFTPEDVACADAQLGVTVIDYDNYAILLELHDADFRDLTDSNLDYRALRLAYDVGGTVSDQARNRMYF
jgi:hypothetical protein